MVHRRPVEPLLPSFLSLISSGIAATEPLWEPLVAFRPGRVHDVLLLASDSYEVWLRCWPAGHGPRAVGADRGSPADHPATEAFTVVRGELVDDTDAHEDRRVIELGETRAGHRAAARHLANVAGGPAVSIHAVSPPLPARRPADPAGATPAVTGRPVPRLPASVTGYAAHPARRRLAG